ncbi:uncharacterized protein J2741_002217 [Methanolinea mesophila]|uniref:HDIG domain-containing metalloprotein n=1 Tax=Methanolinea mesophila TaxID=547055 RepID=UPI001AE66CE9|nr:HDIG domain-containing metalloprotein [Methanolinea mesophila]MBP1929670.1 uncharacterized protein [Methanolinea mesophila]
MPEDGDCERLLRDAGCSANVIDHCSLVETVSVRYARCSGMADTGLVACGACLHDIGRGITHSLHHAQMGAAYCRDIGLPEEVARIVECHTGAGLSADECTLLGLIPISCIPITLEERIVAASDNLVRGGRVITIYDRIARSYALSRKIRRRIYHLWLDVERIAEPGG